MITAVLFVGEGVEGESDGGREDWGCRGDKASQRAAGPLRFTAACTQMHSQLILRLCHAQRVCSID